MKKVDAYLLIRLYVEEKTMSYEKFTDPGKGYDTSAESDKGYNAVSSPTPSSIILITGFEPFGNPIPETNGSWEAVRQLDCKKFGKIMLVVEQLPVVWDEAAIALKKHIHDNKPVAVICFGQAEGDPVRIEQFAHNERYSNLDNKQNGPATFEICSKAPKELETWLPLKEIEASLNVSKIPFRRSTYAGAFLCNEIFYKLMYDPGTYEATKIIRGFIHVPALDQDVPTGVDTATVKFDQVLLQKTAEIIIQEVVKLC